MTEKMIDGVIVVRTIKSYLNCIPITDEDLIYTLNALSRYEAVSRSLGKAFRYVLDKVTQVRAGLDNIRSMRCLAQIPEDEPRNIFTPIIFTSKGRGQAYTYTSSIAYGVLDEAMDMVSTLNMAYENEFELAIDRLIEEFNAYLK